MTPTFRAESDGRITSDPILRDTKAGGWCGFYIPLQFYDGPEGSNANEKTQLKEKAQIKRKHK